MEGTRTRPWFFMARPLLGRPGGGSSRLGGAPRTRPRSLPRGNSRPPRPGERLALYEEAWKRGLSAEDLAPHDGMVTAADEPHVRRSRASHGDPPGRVRGTNDKSRFSTVCCGSSGRATTLTFDVSSLALSDKVAEADVEARGPTKGFSSWAPKPHECVVDSVQLVLSPEMKAHRSALSSAMNLDACAKQGAEVLLRGAGVGVLLGAATGKSGADSGGSSLDRPHGKVLLHRLQSQCPLLLIGETDERSCVTGFEASGI
jgi:hypothetical protein